MREEFNLEEFFKAVMRQLDNLKPDEAIMQHPLVLAYLGDTIYDVFIRTLMVSKNIGNVNKLHKATSAYVKAKSQAETLYAISQMLTEEEAYVVKRGRNAKAGTIPKNADVMEYKHATGFEALLGYLYLKRDFERLMHILCLSAQTKRDI